MNMNIWEILRRNETFLPEAKAFFEKLSKMTAKERRDALLKELNYEQCLKRARKERICRDQFHRLTIGKK